jgi:hypothetical protein
LIQHISLRDRVGGAVVDLLKDEHMECVSTQEGLVLLINALAIYREEGHPLFPQVFIFDSLAAVLKMLPFSEHVSIGSGPKSAVTMNSALKKCAPLASGGWSVYILRNPTDFAFGLFRSGAHMLSVSPAALLVEQGDPEVPALLVHQVAENMVALTGVRGSSITVSFGAARTPQVSPTEARAALVSAIVRDVVSDVQEQAAAFYHAIFSGVLRAAHGTLAVVVPSSKRSLPALFRDGVPLEKPVSASDSIRELLRSDSSAASTRLQGQAALISGMLLSDGITAFASDGSVKAYNIFIKHPKGTSTSTHGGARRRTFDVLSSKVGSHLTFAFMQSQDGATYYKP